MDVERILFFDGLGDITFKKSRRAKRLTIRVKSADEVIVTIPWLVNFGKAESFVIEKALWIKSTMLKIAERAGEITQFNELTEFSTSKYELKIERIEGEKIIRKIGNGKILVSIPFTLEVSSKPVQIIIRGAILEAWRKEAKEFLPSRVDYLANQYGFRYNSLSIKNMKSRWGSCTGRNKINLNLHLIRLPQHLSDYIILHELVHTIHKNHGKYFWESLDKLCGDSKAKAKELTKYQLEIW